MSIRGDLSRKKILDAARRLFAQRGFSAVTMQDVANGADISRGGLYRHYSGTEEIFFAIIAEEQAQAHASLEAAKKNCVPAKMILAHYVRSRLNQICDATICIDNAISEFAANSEAGKQLLKRRAAESIEIVDEMIRLGTKEGDFSCSDPYTAALVINCLLEGLSKHNGLIPLDQKDIIELLAFITKILNT